MKTLLRSTFLVSGADCPELLLQNCRLLESSHFVFFSHYDAAIWAAVRDLTAEGHSPYVDELEQHFQNTKQTGCLERLRELRLVEPVYKGEFIMHLEKLEQVGRTLELKKLLQETEEIVTDGKEIVQGEITVLLRGPVDAVKHFLEKSHAIVSATIQG